MLLSDFTIFVGDAEADLIDLGLGETDMDSAPPAHQPVHALQSDASERTSTQSPREGVSCQMSHLADLLQESPVQQPIQPSASENLKPMGQALKDSHTHQATVAADVKQPAPATSASGSYSVNDQKPLVLSCFLQ